jgi:hypothetical protein
MTFYVNHRHHHKFIKYEKRLRKEGNMPLLTYQAKSLPLQCEFGCVALPSIRSNGPTDPLHISCIFSIWKILHFYSSFFLIEKQTTFCSVFVNNSVFDLHFMKVSTENDNNLRYEKITIMVDNMPLK